MSKLRALERVQCMTASKDGDLLVYMGTYMIQSSVITLWVYLLSDTSVQKIKVRFMA